MVQLIPRVSEKAYAQAQNGTYVFTVPATANKQQVAEAVAAQYSVSVKDVRLVVVKGKMVRAYRGKRQNPGKAARKDTKKAYVNLSDGSIDLFNEKETK